MSELVTPSPALLGLVITISSCYAVAMEIVKRLFLWASAKWRDLSRLINALIVLESTIESHHG